MVPFWRNAYYLFEFYNNFWRGHLQCCWKNLFFQAISKSYFHEYQKFPFEYTEDFYILYLCLVSNHNLKSPCPCVHGHQQDWHEYVMDQQAHAWHWKERDDLWKMVYRITLYFLMLSSTCSNGFSSLFDLRMVWTHTSAFGPVDHYLGMVLRLYSLA